MLGSIKVFILSHFILNVSDQTVEVELQGVSCPLFVIVQYDPCKHSLVDLNRRELILRVLNNN